MSYLKKCIELFQQEDPRVGELLDLLLDRIETLEERVAELEPSTEAEDEAENDYNQEHRS